MNTLGLKTLILTAIVLVAIACKKQPIQFHTGDRVQFARGYSLPLAMPMTLDSLEEQTGQDQLWRIHDAKGVVKVIWSMEFEYYKGR